MPDPNTEHGLRVQLATALRERDLARAEVQAWKDGVCQDCVESRAEVKRLREAAAALRDGYDHVAHCRECGEMSVEHCAQAEGENSEAAKAIEARTGIDAALATGGDRG